MSSTKRSHPNVSGESPAPSTSTGGGSKQARTMIRSQLHSPRPQITEAKNVPDWLEESRDKKYLALWKQYGPSVIEACEAKTEASAQRAAGMMTEWRNAINSVDQLLGMVKDSNSAVSCEVVTFGNNESNQLGHGVAVLETDDWEITAGKFRAPTLIPRCRFHRRPAGYLQDIKPRQVDAGALTLAIVSYDGCLYTAGVSDKGGTGRTINEEDDAAVMEGKPTQVTDFFSPIPNVFCPNNCVMRVAAGTSHMLILSLKGDVFMFGCYIDDGRRFADIRAPNQEKAPTHTGDEEEKQVNDSPWGFNLKPVHVFQIAQKATAIAAGDSFNAAILEDGSLVTWGEFLLLFRFPSHLPTILTCLIPRLYYESLRRNRY
jgi:alpha-tubulin suppressor-like RCC1 family protein